MFTDAAENRGDRQRQMFRVGANVFLDLQNQFPRGGEHQHPRAAPLPGRLRRQLGEHGQRESRRLARARLGNANKVVAREDLRNGCRLNGRGFGVAGFLDGFQNFGIKTKFAK